VRSMINRMLGGRSVAAWTVIGGISGLFALIVAICGFALADSTPQLDGVSSAQPSASSRSNTVTTSPQVEASSSHDEGTNVYLDQLEPVGDNATGPRVMNRTTYQRSLTTEGTYKPYIVSYNVYREYRQLKATIGHADTAATGSVATFIVVADDREIFNSGELKLGDVRQIEVPIKNVFRLTLEIDGPRWSGIEATWGDVHLIK
jgi:hypothetical protein